MSGATPGRGLVLVVEDDRGVGLEEDARVGFFDDLVVVAGSGDG